MVLRPGSRNSVTDVDGVRVGHHHRLDEHWASGTSVVLMPAGATTAVDVRGGGPGTRETDVLAPSHLVQQAHAVVLSGGSAYGLAAADGVMRWLGERGHGFGIDDDPAHVVPIVPAAVLFDLPMSDWGHRPDAQFGYHACAAAGADTRQGNIGAGTGAVAGGVKGGVGTASVVLPGSDPLPEGGTVGAIMAVNSSGSVIDPESGLPWALNTGLGAEFALREPSAGEIASARATADQRPSRNGPVGRPLNTTIGVVATDIGMTKPECQRVAIAAQDGLARAIKPAHAMSDGDTVFAAATGTGQPLPPSDTSERIRVLDEVCAVAAEVVARAIVHAVLAAEPVGEVMSYTCRYPSARE